MFSFKNHTVDWLVFRFSAIISLFSLLFFLFLFIIHVHSTEFHVWNCSTLFYFVWDSWASPTSPLFPKICFFLSFCLLAYHMFDGLVSILHDYVHNDKTKHFGIILILLAIIEFIKHLYIFLFIS